MKFCCSDCTKSSYCIRQYDEEQRASCPILNADNEPLRYRNSEGYSDPTAFFALRSAMELDPKYATAIVMRFTNEYGAENIRLLRNGEKLPYDAVAPQNSEHE